ncbi:MAG: hypothetical protein ACI31S_01390 [Bacilli bacterium]
MDILTLNLNKKEYVGYKIDLIKENKIIGQLYVDTLDKDMLYYTIQKLEGNNDFLLIYDFKEEK